MKQYPLDLKVNYSGTSSKSTSFILVALAIPVVTIIALISSYAWIYN